MTTKPFVIATRNTADGTSVQIWNDGCVTGSDKTTIDQLATLLGLPAWESVAEDYERWYDAVYSVARRLLGDHGLELYPRYATMTARPYDMDITPISSWRYAADKIHQTMVWYGMSSSTLDEFVASGPHTYREAVLRNLSMIPSRGNAEPSSQSLYELAWQRSSDHAL